MDKLYKLIGIIMLVITLLIFFSQYKEILIMSILYTILIIFLMLILVIILYIAENLEKYFK